MWDQHRCKYQNGGPPVPRINTLATLSRLVLHDTSLSLVLTVFCDLADLTVKKPHQENIKKYNHHIQSVFNF